MLKTWITCRLIHIALDFLLVLGAFGLAYFIRIGWFFSSDFPFNLYAGMSFIASGLWIGFLVFSKYYRVPPRSGERLSFDLLLVAAGGAIANSFLVVGFLFWQEVFFSRLILIYVFVLGTTFLFISQWGFRLILAWFKRQKKQTYRTLIVGANRVSEQLIEAINTNRYAPYEIIGVIDPYGLEKSIKGSHILGKLNKLTDICDQQDINAVIQCDAFEHTINLISLCEEKNIKFQFDPALRGIFEKNLRIREVAGQTMISFVKRDFDSDSQRQKYRLYDWILRQCFDID